MTRNLVVLVVLAATACTEDNDVYLGDGAPPDRGRSDLTITEAGCALRTFYNDGDGDGYGDPKVTVKACVKPGGYVPSGDDCDDLDPDAHPGQPRFFAVPTKGTKTFDYDCDKQEELQYGAFASCTWQGGNCRGDGWLQPVPVCGKTGQLVRCTKQGGRSPGCNQNVTNSVQTCR